MSNSLALTISIGVLGAIDTYLTATVLPIPVWVTFIAWASSFAVGGGGSAALIKSVVSNWTGIVIASLMPAGRRDGAAGAPPHRRRHLVSACGSAPHDPRRPRLTLTSAIPPAIVFGFASLRRHHRRPPAMDALDVRALATSRPSSPRLSMLVGALFGIVSEIRRERAGHRTPRRRPDSPAALNKEAPRMKLQHHPRRPRRPRPHPARSCASSSKTGRSGSSVSTSP